MKQIKFIYALRTIGCTDGIEDKGDGIISATIRPGIIIKHDYKHADRMSIKMEDTNEEYTIKNDSQFEEIIRMHLGNTNLSEVLHEYCKKNLVKDT